MPIIYRKAIMKKWSLLLVVALLLAGTYLILISPPGMEWIRRRVESQVNERIQGRLSLGRLQSDIFTRLRIQDLSLRPKGENGQEMLYIEHLELEYRLLALLRRAAIRRLSVEGPTFTLEIDEAGRTNLGQLFSPPDEAVSSASPRRLSIPVPDSLWLKDGMLKVIDRRRGLDWTLGPIQLYKRCASNANWGRGGINIPTISLTSDAFTDTTLSLSGTFQINPDSLRITSCVLSSAYAQMDATGAISLPHASAFQWVSTLNADLSQLQRCVPSLPNMVGQAVLRVKGMGTLSHPKIYAEVDLTDAQFPWGDVPTMQASLTLTDRILTLNKLAGQMNGGSFLMTGNGDFSTSDPEYRINILLEKMGLIPVFEYFLPERRMAGLLDMDVELHGQGIQEPIWAARGDIGLTDLQIGHAGIGDLHIEGTYLDEQVDLSGSVETILWHASGYWGSDGIVDLQLNANASDLTPLTSLLKTETQGEAMLTAHVHGHVPQLQLSAHIQGDSLRVGAFQCESLSATLDVDSTVVATMDLQTHKPDGRLTGQFNIKQHWLEAGHLVIDSLDVADCIIWADHLGIDGLLNGTVDAEGPLDLLSVESHLRLSDAKWKGQPWGNFNAQFALADSLFNAQVMSADSALSAQVHISLTPVPHFDAALSLDNFALEPMLLSAGIPHVKGTSSMRVQVSGPFDDLAKVQGYATLERFVMMIHGKRLYAPHKTQIVLEGGRLSVGTWDLVDERTHISMVGELGPGGEQQFQLDLDPLPLDLFSLATPWGDTLDGILEGTVSVSGSAESPRIHGQLQLTDLNVPGVHGDTLSIHFVYAEREARTSLLWKQSGRGQLAGDMILPLHLSFVQPSVTAMRGPMQIAASAQSFRLSWLKALLPHASEHLEGILHGQVELRGDPKNWRTWRGGLSIDSLRVTEAEAGLVNINPIRVELDRGDIRVISFAMGGHDIPEQGSRLLSDEVPVQQEPQLVLEGTLSFTEESDLSIGVHHLEGRLPGAFVGLEDQIRGPLDMDLTWDGTPEYPKIKGKWQAIDGDFHPVTFDRFEGVFTYADRQVTLDNVELVLGSQTLYLDATIPADLRLSKPPNLNIPGRFHLRVHAPWLDLSQLPIKIPEWTKLKGSLYIDAAIGGSLKRPTGIVDIKATNIEAKWRSLDDAFSFDQIVLYADSTTVTIATDGGRLGPGKLNVSGGMSLAPQTWGAFSVEFYGTGVPIRVPRTIDLTATTYLTWKGRPHASTCSGHIEVAEGVFRKPLSLSAFSPFRERIERPAKIPSPWLKGMALNVGLNTQRPFQVRADVVDIPLNISMHIGGTMARPSVLGSIESDEGGHIYYLDRQFVVDHLRLQSNNPHCFDPEVSLQAHTELLDIKDVTPYTITLNATGSMSQLEVNLSSAPSLGPLDIMSLLTLGTTKQMSLSDSEVFHTLITDRARDLAIQRAMGLTSQQFSRVLGTYGINVNAHASDVSKWVGARVRLDKRLTQRMLITYSTSVGASANQRVEVDYKLTDHLSLETQTDEDGDAGVDLRFKYRF